MLNLIPKVKVLEEKESFLAKDTLCFDATLVTDKRLATAMEKLPLSVDGARVSIGLMGDDGEGYDLWIDEDEVRIQAEGPAGAFYAIQTLRQIFEADKIPCLHIKDRPDFGYRGFYHDVTRGKVPTVETIKGLIDYMAYYKLNSLQLYVEHTYEFKETEELTKTTGCLTAAELQELDRYCQENFIEFIPSLSTFGHMYEILQQEKYHHLRILKDYTPSPNFWVERMAHHTIDPKMDESEELVKSLIDQYAPNFTSEYFNICGDETFDLLKQCEESGEDVAELYVGFVNKTISHLKSKGKKIMMWFDILVKHPEAVHNLPEDTIFLNWDYSPDVTDRDATKIRRMGRKQIVCPGTWTWTRLCEDVQTAVPNIIKMIDYGYQNGAIGVLNTNWGDHANPCSIELALYGMVLGAAKSWTVDTAVDEAYNAAVGKLLYGSLKGTQYLTDISAIHCRIPGVEFTGKYFSHRYGDNSFKQLVTLDTVREVQGECTRIIKEVSADTCLKEAFKEEMIVAAEGFMMAVEFAAKMSGLEFERITDSKAGLEKFSKLWLSKNKPSELNNIVKLVEYCDSL